MKTFVHAGARGLHCISNAARTLPSSFSSGRSEAGRLRYHRNPPGCAQLEEPAWSSLSVALQWGVSRPLPRTRRKARVSRQRRYDTTRRYDTRRVARAERASPQRRQLGLAKTGRLGSREDRQAGRGPGDRPGDLGMKAPRTSASVSVRAGVRSTVTLACLDLRIPILRSAISSHLDHEPTKSACRPQATTTTTTTWSGEDPETTTTAVGQSLPVGSREPEMRLAVSALRLRMLGLASTLVTTSHADELGHLPGTTGWLRAGFLLLRSTAASAPASIAAPAAARTSFRRCRIAR
ncbi:uncharacterized protein PSFLO_05196 [Pseudozyma flocculosa]|uniref:Uncharacterized protein n=1 Tax=Pseudozyma flocculosa TaxID=84751 RepID=A0A5C3F7L4_9BASI|nr:uncharacterized protein PSFLO_05196 [Pseudozyma flocculosa]